MDIVMPKKVAHIIDILEKSGFEAYAVGGCVRDIILGKEPNDWDITTSAKPDEVKKLFRRTIDTGIEHGTVTVMIDKEGFEVTTYRIDGEYKDNRHPKQVIFTDKLKEDLKRRDFTINAMAFNYRRGIVDEFGGMKDLQDGIIRCVGEPEERFGEDALRILRAVRFAAQLDFDIHEDTCRGITMLAQNLTNISKERIQTELDKMICSNHPEKVLTAYELGITRWILPEFDRMMDVPQNSIYHMYNVGVHTVKVMENIENDHYLRWAALLHDIGKPDKHVIGKDGYSHFYGHGDLGEDMSRDILKSLKFDNKTVKIVSRLVKHHDDTISLTDYGVKKAVVRVGCDIFPMLIKLKWADLAGKSDYSKEHTTVDLKQLQDIYENIVKRGDCIELKSMAVNGKDLIEWGLKPGEEVGAGLEKLFNEVLRNPENNTKEKLKKIIFT